MLGSTNRSRASLIGLAVLAGSSSVGLAATNMRGLVSPYATATMDGGYGTFYEQGANAAEPLAGLPHAGVVYSFGDPSSQFLFQSYTSNNALFLTANSGYGNAVATTGTLTFATPDAAGNLAFAVAAGNFGGENLNLTIHYQGAPDLSTSITNLADWTGGAGVIIAGGTGKAYALGNPGTSGLYGASFAFFDGTASTPPNIPRIFEVVVPHTQQNANLAFPITSIDVSLVPGANNQSGATAAIFGVSASGSTNFFLPEALTASSFNQDVVVEAAAASAVPEPAALGMIAFGGLLIRRRRSLDIGRM